MNAEFVAAGVLVYANDGGADEKHSRSVELLTGLFEDQAGRSACSTSEFNSVAVKKLGMKPEQAEALGPSPGFGQT
jgi:hypothetical protein